MEKEIVFSIEENEQSGYVAEAPEYAVQAEADSLDEVVRAIHYTVLSEFDEQERPTLISMELPEDRGSDD